MRELKTILVNVTEEHIRTGKRCDSYDCPIAYAILDAYGQGKPYVEGSPVLINNYRAVRVGQTYIATPGSLSARILMPAAMLGWMRAFDSKKPVVPFSFTLKEVAYSEWEIVDIQIPQNENNNTTQFTA